MATARVNGLRVGYEVIGEGRPWVLTPGGRESRDTPGLRELAEDVAGENNEHARAEGVQLALTTPMIVPISCDATLMYTVSHSADHSSSSGLSRSRK